MPRTPIHTFSDRFICYADNALRTLTPGTVKASSPNPADTIEPNTLTAHQQRHHGRLMRINHTGEVCAQGLYQGQALTARSPELKVQMSHAAKEELDHLAWCEDRLKQLDNRTSVLNPAFYGLSFALGAIAGAIGDKWSLGFVAATEEQVSAHLSDHLEQIEDYDPSSNAILKQMLEDEQRHAEGALEAGGVNFHPLVKRGMTLISKVMTKSVYRL